MSMLALSPAEPLPIGVNDDGRLTGFALAVQQAEVNVLANDSGASAVHDSMGEGKVLEVIADIAIAGDLKGSLVAGLMVDWPARI